MREDGLVSIITPMRDAEKYIESTINSVLAQTYKTWEMIIVDDGSADASLEIAERYAAASPNIKIISQTRSAGIAGARNKGLARARGRYAAFIDSDDIWKEDKLSAQLDFMRANGYTLTYTACELIDESGAPMNKTLAVRDSVGYKELLRSNCIVCSSVIADLNEITVFMPNLRHEDYAAWLGILREGHTAHGLNAALTKYRIRKSSVSANKLKSLAWVFNIYKNYLKMPAAKALLNVVVYFFCAAAKYAGALGAVIRKA